MVSPVPVERDVVSETVRVLVDWEYDVGRHVVHRRRSFLDQCYYGADEVALPVGLWERYVRLERERLEVRRLLGEHLEGAVRVRNGEQQELLGTPTYATFGTLVTVTETPVPPGFRL